MRTGSSLISISLLLCITAKSFAGLFSPHIDLAVEGGATRSYLKTNGNAEYFFAPTSHLKPLIAPQLGLKIHLALGKYVAFASGLQYNVIGQSTEPTTVYFKNDIYEHDFESSFTFRYLCVPVILKAGMRASHFSVYLKGGILPSLLLDDEMLWIIDGKEADPQSSILPDVKTDWWDISLHFGGEIGYYFGKNGLFIVGNFNSGMNDIASEISGEAFTRSYGVVLQYRR